MKKLFPAAAILGFCAAMSTPAHSFTKSCWMLANLKGTALYLSDGFKPTPDGFTRTNPSIKLIFGGNGAVASGDNLGLAQVGNYMAVGSSDGEEVAIVETYNVDPATGTVLYTRSSHARGVLSSFTGTKSFVGQASPC